MAVNRAYSEQHANKVMKLKTRIENYGLTRAEQLNCAGWSEDFKATQVAKLKEQIEQIISETYNSVDAEYNKDIKAAKAAATKKLSKIDPTVRTYEAVVAEQDIRARASNPKALMGLYEEASKQGNIARQAELKRLMDPILENDDASKYDWDVLKRSLRTPEEVDVDHLQSAYEMYQGHRNGIEDTTRQLLSQVEAARDPQTAIEESRHDGIMNAYFTSVAKAAFKGGEYSGDYDAPEPQY